MNHAHPAASSRSAQKSSSLSIWQKIAAAKRYVLSFKDKPFRVGSALTPPDPLWIVSATITKQAEFGTLSMEPKCLIEAKSESDALRLARVKLETDHSGFTATFLKAASYSEP